MPSRTSKSHTPIVALLIETSNAFSRELLHGVRDWMREHTAWTIHLSEQGRGNKPPAWLKGWRGDGVIARIETKEIAKAVRDCGVPVINVSASGIATDFPTVISDSAAIAKLAAQHLIERGIRHFAYCGDARFAWSKQHGIHFSEACHEIGAECHMFGSTGGDDELAAITRWLAKLPRPVGIMSCYDIRGQQVLDACRKLGLRVPDDVAVISQHNDELLCDLCQPPLTSVIPGARQAGLEAAAMLDKLMQGKRVTPSIVKIAPIGVATRLSTDTVAVSDPRLAIAVRYLRDHACEPLQIHEVAKISGLSRTLLERMLRKHLGVSPYEQVLRHRMARAELLLTTTTLTIAEVAQRVGFATVEHFATTYKRRVGKTPGSRVRS